MADYIEALEGMNLDITSVGTFQAKWWEARRKFEEAVGDA